MDASPGMALSIAVNATLVTCTTKSETVVLGTVVIPALPLTTKETASTANKDFTWHMATPAPWPLTLSDARNTPLTRQLPSAEHALLTISWTETDASSQFQTVFSTSWELTSAPDVPLVTLKLQTGAVVFQEPSKIAFNMTV